MRLFLAIVFALASAAAGAECVPYESEATLKGIVHFRVAPGAPNYENIEAGDRAERQPILDLYEPTCIEGQRGGITITRQVLSVQLLPPPGSRLASLENRPVTVIGTISGRMTVNAKVPVLMRMTSVRADPRR
ncbi:MAG TPA: hypothetical protein VI319_01050 [Burkholderiales bacterium]